MAGRHARGCSGAFLLAISAPAAWDAPNGVLYGFSSLRAHGMYERPRGKALGQEPLRSFGLLAY